MPNQPKLSDADAIAIRYAIAAGQREADLAREYGVTRATINLVKQNRLHANLGIDVSAVTRQSRTAQNAEARQFMDQLEGIYLLKKGDRVRLKADLSIAGSTRYLQAGTIGHVQGIASGGYVVLFADSDVPVKSLSDREIELDEAQ
jgi:uncharacterized Zn ribbon protein